MKILDRYLLREFFAYLALGLVGFISIFVVVDIIEKADVFLDHHAPLALIWRFYLYRAPAKSTTWEPEFSIDLETWRRLRTDVENRWLSGQGPSGAAECGTDEPEAYVACEGPYLVHVRDPGINPPNLAAVQEISAGIYRVAQTVTSPFLVVPSGPSTTMRSPRSRSSLICHAFSSSRFLSTSITSEPNSFRERKCAG